MKSMRSSHAWIRAVCILGGAFAMQTRMYATDLPSINLLIDRAVRRETLFDNLDANFTLCRYNPSRETPVFKESCRWIKHGNKMHVDYQRRDYIVADREILKHTCMTFDGEVARSLSAQAMKGKVFRDFTGAIVRGHFDGPDIMGITLPMASGETLSSLLRGEPLVAPRLEEKVNRSVSIAGRTNVDGTSCIVVDVTLGDSPERQELTRLFLAEDYDYCVFQAEHSLLRNGVANLGSRIRMSGFQRVRDSLWYPREAKYEAFQGEKEPKQTTWYKTEKIAWPERFDESLFVLEFPAGTHVFDTITGVDYVAGGSHIGELHFDGGQRFEIGPIDTNLLKSGAVAAVLGTGTKTSTALAEISAENNMPAQSQPAKPSLVRKMVLLVVVILTAAAVVTIKRRLT